MKLTMAFICIHTSAVERYSKARRHILVLSGFKITGCMKLLEYSASSLNKGCRQPCVCVVYRTQNHSHNLKNIWNVREGYCKSRQYVEAKWKAYTEINTSYLWRKLKGMFKVAYTYECKTWSYKHWPDIQAAQFYNTISSPGF